MRTTALLVASLLLVGGGAAAQEPDAFVGHFVDAATGDSELLLVPALEGAPGELEGVLFLADAAGALEVRGVVTEGVLRGRCTPREGEPTSQPLSVRAVPEGVLVDRADGEVRFERVPGSPREVAALREMLARLLPDAGPEGNERAAIVALKLLVRKQTAFRDGDVDGDGAADFATLAELAETGRIEGLADGEWRGYRFAVGVSADGARWMATAAPLEPGVSGSRCFVVTHEGAIHVTKGPAPLTDECAVPPGATRLGARPAQAGPDLSHVHPGQRYLYVLRNPGAPDMQMIYRVKAVEGASVKYDIVVLMDMGQGLAPVGPPTPQEWRYEPAPGGVAPAPFGAKVETTREEVEVGAVRFDCLVTTVGNTQAWIPVTGDVPTFPGIVRSITDGKVTMELVSIQE